MMRCLSRSRGSAIGTKLTVYQHNRSAQHVGREPPFSSTYRHEHHCHHQASSIIINHYQQYNNYYWLLGVCALALPRGNWLFRGLITSIVIWPQREHVANLRDTLRNSFALWMGGPWSESHHHQWSPSG